MIIYSATANVIALLFFLLAGILDLYISATSLRAVFWKLPGTRSSRMCAALRDFTDPLVNGVRRRLALWTQRPVPSWLAWTITLGLVVAVRQVLLTIVLAMQ